MILEVLGSGGSITTPKILCSCDSCKEAREKGEKYTRLGPSVFIHGPNVLIDTPEEISIQINRTEITEINACFYSHWHPDHTAGKRVFEAGIDYINVPPKNKSIDIVLTEKIAETFENRMGLMFHFNFMEEKGIIKKKIIGNNESIDINGYKIEPIQLAQDYVFGYIIYNESSRILIIMDELKDWIPGKEILKMEFDIVYLPFGLFELNPLTNKRLYPKDHYLMESDNTISETIEIIKQLHSKMFVLSHIEESDNITIGLANSLAEYYSKMTTKNIKIAYDTMKVST